MKQIKNVTRKETISLLRHRLETINFEIQQNQRALEYKFITYPQMLEMNDKLLTETVRISLLVTEYERGEF